MTISTALKGLSVVTIVLAVAVAAVATTGAPAEAAKPAVRDHRNPSPWQLKEKKKNNPTVIRDHRNPSTWQPKTQKPRWPHYPHKH